VPWRKADNDTSTKHHGLYVDVVGGTDHSLQTGGRKDDHMKASKVVGLVAPFTLALLAAPALAHGPGGGLACRPLLQELCPNATPGPGPGGYRSCLKALCSNLTPGPGAFASCLLAQKGISNFPSCQAQLTEMQAKIAAWQSAFNTACATDVTQFCGNVATGQRGQTQCLRQAIKDNKAVSGTCQTLLATYHGHHQHGDAWHGECGEQNFGK
jgi:hypothetical protein